jgi:hypothetical protein
MAAVQAELFRPHTSILLARAGETLFGHDWQSPMARALHLNVRTVQRIAAAARKSEPYPVSAAALDTVTRLLDDRAAQCAEVRTEIEDARGV